MALTFGFYNAVNGDRKYNAEQMSSLFEGIIKDGVFMSIGQKMMVTAKTGMNITVGTGRAWFNRTWTNNDSEYPLTIATSEVVLNRIDVVVLEVNANDANRANTIKIIKGTPNSVPVAPVLTISEKVNQYALAHIYVGAGVTSILGGNITNKIGTTACPFVIGVMETMSVDALIAQWNAAYTTWFNTISTEGSNMLSDFNSEFQTLFADIDATAAGQITTLDTEFHNWFTNLNVILAGDVAANLAAGQLALETEVKVPTRTSKVSTYAPVVGLGVGSKNGLVKGLIKGASLYNSVVNGNFANGITGWTGVGATMSTLNNIMSVTGTGAGPYAGINGIGESIIGNKYFIMAKVRVTNSLCTSISINRPNSTGVVITTNPIINTWYSGYMIVTADQLELIRIVASYANNANATGAIMEVDGIHGVFAINQNALGLESLTADQMADLCINGYFEGLAGSKVDFESVGANLFDSTKATLNSDLNGTNGVTFAIKGRLVTDFIPVHPSTTYTSNEVSMRRCFYDSSKRFISGLIPGIVKTFTTPSNCKFVRESFYMGLNIQINLGTIAPSYQPFKSNKLTLSQPLHSVPAISDTYNLETGQYTKNVGAGTDGLGYVLKSADIVNYYVGETNIDFIEIKKNSDFIKYNLVTEFLGEIYFPNFKNGLYDNNVANIGNIFNGVATITMGLIVAKGTYANLSAAQAALAGTKILYQLATPVITQLDKDLLAFEAGTLYSKGSPQPLLEFTAPLNSAATDQDFNVIAEHIERTLNGGVATAAQGVKADNALPATAKAVDSDKLDGKDSTEFLLVGATAADSQKLDGIDSTGFARADSNYVADINTMIIGGMYRIQSNPNIPAGYDFGHLLVIRGIAISDDTITQLITAYDNKSMAFRSCGTANLATTPWITMWNANNDGANSGLDAGLLAGVAKELMFVSKGDIAGNTSATPGKGALAYRVLTDISGMLYPATYGVGASFSSGNGNGEYTLHLYKAGGRLWMQQTGDGAAIAKANWFEIFTIASYDFWYEASGSFTLSAAHDKAYIFLQLNVDTIITVATGLPVGFTCNVVGSWWGNAKGSFAPGAGVLIHSNPDDTKRTLNGKSAAVNVRVHGTNTNEVIIAGNLKV